MHSPTTDTVHLAFVLGIDGKCHITEDQASGVQVAKFELCI
jgi:hypothetical protein